MMPNDIKKITVSVVTVSVLLGAFLLSKTIGEIKGYPAISTAPNGMINSISVNGLGEVYAVPDIATVTLSATNEAKVLSDAQKVTNEQINKAIEFLKSQAIDEKDIKTTGYNSYPKYEQQYQNPQPCTMEGPCMSMPVQSKSVLIGYEVNQSITVKIRKTDAVGTIVDGLGKLKLSNISAPQFSVDDDGPVKTEARQKAITNAKEKAAAIAKDLGVRLVRITNFYEQENQNPYYDAGMGGGYAGVSMKAENAAIPAGQNKINSMVSITYEIR